MHLNFEQNIKNHVWYRNRGLSMSSLANLFDQTVTSSIMIYMVIALTSITTPGQLEKCKTSLQAINVF